ncbi:MAG: aminotransferase class V-fold PLP-dependent enzyme [Bacteroidales bacterium]
MDRDLILQSTFKKIDDYITSNNTDPGKVIKFKSPAELTDIIDFKIHDTGVAEDEFISLIDKYLEYSVRTGNMQFFSQLYSGFNFPAFIGDVLTTLTNTSMATYEIAPVATVIEKEMIGLMSSFAGYKDGEGIFVSGGSNANLIAMLSARNQIFKEGRAKGYDSNLKLKAFVSENAHYSFEIAAGLIGTGTKSVVKIRTDTNGKMIPEELENEIKRTLVRGETPFFVAATCGTTMSGSFDPLVEISDICKRYDVWFHADGSLGGSLLLSDKYRYLMDGLERTDSFAWNPHKLMNIPLVCSMILIKKRGILNQNVSDINKDYIFHDLDGIEDLGEKSLQCGRKVDAVKLWFAMKYYGIKGYRQRIDNIFELAAYAEEIVNSHPNLELLISRQSFTVCFRYVSDNVSDLNDLNLKIREHLRKSGKSVVNFGFIDNVLTIRLVTVNGELKRSDIDLFFENFLMVSQRVYKIYEISA